MSKEHPKLPQKAHSLANTSRPPPEGPSTAAYVDYAIDMMAHNLVSAGSAGKLDPRKAPHLKTGNIRTQILARLEAMQKSSDHNIVSTEKKIRPTYSKAAAGAGGAGLPAKKPPARRWAVQPNSLPIAIITDKKPKEEDFPSQKIQRKSKFIGKASIGVGIGPSISYAANLQGTRSSVTSKSGVAVPLKTAVQFQKIPLNRRRSKSGSPAVTRPSISKQDTTKSKERLKDQDRKSPSRKNLAPGPTESQTKHFKESERNKIKPLERPTPSKPSLNVHNRRLFRASLDMKGFLNEEISLDLDGHKLTVTGIRGKREDLNARRVTETLDLPPEVDVDRLKIARRADGFLILQESTQPPP